LSTHEYLLQKYGTTLSFQQASEETGIFWQTIREMCLRGEIKTPRAGRHWVLTTKALAEYLDNGSKGNVVILPTKSQSEIKHKKIV
jgi:hypothetical protein